MLIVAYLLIFWIDPAATGSQEVPVGSPTDFVPKEHYFQLGFLPIPETKLGGICLFFAVCLTLIRKNLSKKFHTELGGAKRLIALSTAVASCIMSPFALYQYVNVSAVLCSR